MPRKRLAGSILLALSAALPGQDLLTPAAALELAFPKATVERTTVSLDTALQARVVALSGQEPAPAIAFPYVARKDDKVIGTAYFDTHRIRAQRETLMIVVAPDGRIDRVEVVAFGEPRQYLPKGGFYGQFPGRGLDGAPSLAKDLRTVAGATLTSQATVAACKRVLAVHRALQEAAAKEKEKEQATEKEREAKEKALKEGKEKESKGSQETPVPAKQPVSGGKAGGG